jgi:cytochrome c oxidase subunit 4
MDDHSNDNGNSHAIPPSVYVGIWVTLMVLTAVTVFASEIDLGVFNIVLALLIATVKGTLVVLFFMHLKYSPKLTAATVVAAVFFMFLLFSLSMTDYLTRAWPTFPTR